MPTSLESWLQRYCITSPKKAVVAPMEEILQGSTLTEIASGLQSRVFQVQNAEMWVMKEGRWDMDIQLFKDIRVPVPAKLTEAVWKKFSQTFLPTEKEILRQYKLYLQFVEYFGFFGPESGCGDCYFHPQKEKMIERQRTVRGQLPDRLRKLEKAYKMTLPESVGQILLSETRFHNFVPKEYLLMGPSISPQNKGQMTSFVFQEWVEGTHFHDVRERELESPYREQCILFLLLLLLLHLDHKLLPDTRPRYMILQAHDWLSKTDNIIVGKDGLKFIDTRWFWETNSNIVKRGLFVPEVVISQAKELVIDLAQTM